MSGRTDDRAAAAAAEAVIDVRDLRKEYSGRAAVDGVSFTVGRGEVFALLGPNGAGKTTTVSILEGHRERTAGSVRVLGVDPRRAPRAWYDRIGIVLQSSTDHANWRVGELVSGLARCYTDPLTPTEALAAVGLEGRSKSLIGTLSGGQRRRLDVALGILGRPEVIFLDEPTTGFDPEARRSFWRLIERLHVDGACVLLTTHYLDEAEHLAQRVGVIKEGRMIEISTPDGLGAGRVETVVSWTEGAQRRSTRTGDVAAVLRELQDRLGATPEDLEIKRPTLEDRYLDLIGERS